MNAWWFFFRLAPGLPCAYLPRCKVGGGVVQGCGGVCGRRGGESEERGVDFREEGHGMMRRRWVGAVTFRIRGGGTEGIRPTSTPGHASMPL